MYARAGPVVRSCLSGPSSVSETRAVFACGVFSVPCWLAACVRACRLIVCSPIVVLFPHPRMHARLVGPRASARHPIICWLFHFSVFASVEHYYCHLVLPSTGRSPASSVVATAIVLSFALCLSSLVSSGLLASATSRSLSPSYCRCAIVIGYPALCRIRTSRLVSPLFPLFHSHNPYCLLPPPFVPPSPPPSPSVLCCILTHPPAVPHSPLASLVCVYHILLWFALLAGAASRRRVGAAGLLYLLYVKLL